MSVLEAQGITKEYDLITRKVQVLHGIDLSFSNHEFCGIVGPSGSGKTTLLYVLSGLEKSSGGKIFFDGQDMTAMTEEQKAKIRQSDIAFVFQFYNLLPNLTVYENIEIAALIRKSVEKAEIMRLLDLVGLTDFANHFPNQLSGGMQQRVAIARALIGQPKVIFADEPTGNLDFQSAKNIMDLFHDIYEKLPVTIIMVTHNLDNLQYCTRKVELLDGRILSDEALR